ncbi:hypothetical protein BDQ17DRAFT_1545255 [Cyathus striatus]|nr:hypothetical protein BDQ17DRAFT_1545255 [Cyathus striatus]
MAKTMTAKSKTTRSSAAGSDSKKDVAKPKRPPTLYNLFIKENTKKWREAHPEDSYKNAFKEVAKMWKDAPENPNRGKPSSSKKKGLSEVSTNV